MPETIKPDDPRIEVLRTRIDEIAHDAQSTSTWGLFFEVLGIIVAVVALMLVVLGLSGAFGSPAVIAVLIALISFLICLLEKRREQWLIEKLRVLRQELLKLGGSTNDGK